MSNQKSLSTLLTNTDFNGANCRIYGYDYTDITTTSDWIITGNEFLLWSVAHMNIAAITARAVTAYDTDNYLVGFDSVTSDTIKISLDNLADILEADATGMDLDAMFDSAGNHILSTRKGAIISLVNSTGTVGIDTLNGYTIDDIVDSTTGTPSATQTLVDVTATFDQTILNNNFATIATSLNQIQAALTTNADVASLRDKAEEILAILRATGGHGLIQDTL